MSSPVVVSRIQNRRGTQAQFNALYPPGYNGLGGCDVNVWPNILQAGELGLCTDTRRMFMGNINGEYIELTEYSANYNVILLPLVIQLAPAATFTLIPQLTYPITPFMSFLYDITNSLSPNWNAVTPDLAITGRLDVTSTSVTSTLSDTSTEINLLAPAGISFIAQHAGSTIHILYKHDFPTTLTLSTSTIRWAPFI